MMEKFIRKLTLILTGKKGFAAGFDFTTAPNKMLVNFNGKVYTLTIHEVKNPSGNMQKDLTT